MRFTERSTVPITGRRSITVPIMLAVGRRIFCRPSRSSSSGWAPGGVWPACQLPAAFTDDVFTDGDGVTMLGGHKEPLEEGQQMTQYSLMSLSPAVLILTETAGVNGRACASKTTAGLNIQALNCVERGMGQR